MTNETPEQARARVAALIGPFPAEVSDRHVDWVRVTAGAGMWEREDLTAGLRSAVTLGVLTALGAQTELAVHVRRAVTHSGLSRGEVAELLRHCSVYAGVPRANDALSTAKTVFDTLDAQARGQS
ncbi:MAG: 4-carboxymuconolactone decarboxylase [Chloroflexi bacterium]|nr:4-carboxymuconolactone decarboxylase [Chloroflexota bacterium]